MSREQPLLPRRIWYPWSRNLSSITAARAFDVERATGTFRLAISCSGAYTVLLNGQPAPAADEPAPSWWTMHYLDVSALVQPGTNEIVVSCRDDGPRPPYLLAVLDRIAADATQRLAATDETWRLAPRAVDHPDEAAPHDPAWAFDGVWAEPWGMPNNCPDDFLRLTHGRQTVAVEPLHDVVRVEDGTGEWLARPSAEGLFARTDLAGGPPLPPINWHTGATMSHLIAEHVFRQTNEWLEQYEYKCPRAIYRLPYNTFGRLVLRNRGNATACVAVTLGESVGEVTHYNRRLTEYFTLRPGERRGTRVSGFQVAKLVLFGSTDEVRLEGPLVQHMRYPAPSPGAFLCNDETVNRIWEVAVRTIHNCMQNEIWDGARRDYLPWMGDLHAENLAAYHALGDRSLPRRTLAVLRELGPDPIAPPENRVYAGLSATWRNPQAPEVNGFPSYTAWWIVGLFDYWMYSGDRAFVASQLDGLPAILDQVLSHVDEHDRWLPDNFVDWADMTAAERRWTNHGLALRACAGAIALLREFGRTADSERYAARWERMRQGYAEAVLAAPLVSHHAFTAAVLSGALDDEAAARVYTRYLDHRTDAISTPWWRFYEMEAASHVGADEYAFSRLREHWQPMLEAGATTFWEQFHAKWLNAPDPHSVASTYDSADAGGYGGYRISQCHGWSAGPAVWLHRHVLGVTPLAAGFAAMAFDPDLHGLEWARGTVPTPHGPITVELTRDAARVALPPGVTGTFVPTGETFTRERTFPLG